MTRYCVSTLALSSGENVVHRIDDGCSLAPKAGGRVDLGSFSSDEAAMREATRHFDKIDGCPECMPECNDDATADAINAAVAAVITVTNM